MENIIYLGLFNAKYGYGDAARGYRDIIKKNKWPVKCIEIDTAEGWRELSNIDLSDKTLIMHKRPVEDIAGAKQKLLYSAKKRVFMTVWECDKLPATWSTQMVGVPEIIVPSQFSADAILTSYPKKKVKILPHILNNFPDVKPFEELVDDKINVLALTSQLTGRKGIDLILAGYYCLPRSITSKCRLIIKGVEGTANFCRSYMIEQNKPEIVCIENYMEDLDMERLLTTADVLFSPNRGEGFGIDIVRGMYLGIDIVATDKGGYVPHVVDYENYFPIESEWDCAFDKATYHDTDVCDLMWPSPTIRQTRDALALCLTGATKKKYDIAHTNDALTIYNENVTNTWKTILEELA